MSRTSRGSILILLVVLGAFGVAASAASASVVTVQATGTGGFYYNDTGIFVPAGKSVTVSGASGTWAICPPSCAMVTAAGDPAHPGPNPQFANTTADGGTLIGSIDGGTTWTAIGTGSVGFSGPGTLLLATNDIPPQNGDCGFTSASNACYSDNSGSVDVNVLFNNVPKRTGECGQNGWQNLNDSSGRSFTSQGNCIKFVRSQTVFQVVKLTAKH